MIEDAKDNKIPKGFQTEEGIKMHLCEKTNELILPKHYRKRNNEEFRYFISRMVPTMNPSGHQFLLKRGIELVSDILSASDEAYALMVIYNEIHRWDADVQNDNRSGEPHSRKETKLPKKFNFSKSGQKDGWSIEGRQLFGKLHKEITKRHAENKLNGSKLEEAIRDMYAQIDNVKDKPGLLSKTQLSAETEKVESFVPPDIEDVLNTSIHSGESKDVSGQDKLQDL